MKTREEMERLLERMPVGCLCVATESGPYAVAVNYLFLDGSVYLHSAKQGRKIEAIKANPEVCFLAHECGPLVIRDKSCGIGQAYKSVICFGEAALVEDAGEKRSVLEKMIDKYAPNAREAKKLDAENVERTAIIKITIAAMSGKANEIT